MVVRLLFKQRPGFDVGGLVDAPSPPPAYRLSKNIQLAENKLSCEKTTCAVGDVEEALWPVADVLG